MERSLRDLRRINKYLGGRSIYRKLLGRFNGARSILDVGTGTSDNLEQLDGLRIGLDFKIEHLRYFRDASIHRVVGDALHLPFRDGAVDVVTSAHFFHHFTPEQNAHILGESLRASRRGVVVNDTRRHYVPLLVVLLFCVLRVFGRITRSDAPGSVRRGYTIEEVEEIVARVDAPKKSVVSVWPYRFGIFLWK